MKITVEYASEKHVPLKIVSARYKNDYTVELVFSDKRKRSVKFGSFLQKSRHSTVRGYLRKDRFKNFHLDAGNIVWGEKWDLIFPIEQLYNGKIL